MIKALFKSLTIIFFSCACFGFGNVLEMDGNELIIINTGKNGQPLYTCSIPDKYLNSDKSLFTPIAISIYNKNKQVLFSIKTYENSIILDNLDLPSSTYILSIEIEEHKCDYKLEWQ